MNRNKKLKIKSELETVYIDSSGTRHIDYAKAMCAEAQIQLAKDAKFKQRQKIMKIVELIMQILESENWGVYYKNQPIQPLEMQDGNSLYQVNRVAESEIENVIETVEGTALSIPSSCAGIWTLYNPIPPFTGSIHV